MMDIINNFSENPVPPGFLYFLLCFFSRSD